MNTHDHGPPPGMARARNVRARARDPRSDARTRFGREAVNALAFKLD